MDGSGAERVTCSIGGEVAAIASVATIFDRLPEFQLVSCRTARQISWQQQAQRAGMAPLLRPLAKIGLIHCPL